MNPLLVDVAQAVDTERLRQAQALRPGRRIHSHHRRTMTHRTARTLPLLLLAAVVFVLALGSTATAGKLITGKQIKNGTVTGIDLKDRSVTGTDVADDSLTSVDFAEAIVGPTGPRGGPGFDGERGRRGPTGKAVLTYEIAPMTLAKSANTVWAVSCPGSLRVLGGGVSSSDEPGTRILNSAPENGGVGWVVEVKNIRTDPITGYAWAVCAGRP